MNLFGGSLGAAFLGSLLLVKSAGAQAPLQDSGRQAPPSYERWSAPETLQGTARELLHAARLSGHQSQQHFAYDWRLGRASAGLLDWAQAHAGEPFPLARLRALAWAEGWTDGELAGVAITAAPAQLTAALRREVRTLLADGAQLDQIGLAVTNGPAAGPQTAVVALSRRLVHLGPVPQQVVAGGGVVLTGQLAAPHVRRASLALACPNGTARLVPVALRHGFLHAHLQAGEAAGRLQVQLLVERNKGPEVAADFPLQVRGPQEVASPADVAPCQAHSSLLALLYGLRRAHNLPLPVPTPTLMRVAQQHANDMVQHHFFAHVSRRTGNVVQRLAAVHQPYLHVVENIAEGTDTDGVFAQWLQSPSHKLNLLDPRVDAVGLATVAGGAEAPTVAVLVMAALPPP